MMRALAILRPEPGASATVARAQARGMATLRVPLFEVVPMAWDVPDAGAFDCLLLTSGNAVHHAGPGLAALAGLPVLAVGSATADAARARGLNVVVTGTQGVAALGEWARAMDFARALHLAGRDRVEGLTLVADTRIVYANEIVWPADAQVASLKNSVALVHSPRAAQALADVAGDLRGSIRIAAISAAALAAAGEGWEAAAVAALPNDDALLDAAQALAIDPPGRGEDNAP